ncbi:MAG: hypothetical protein Kow00121_13500 [Elainellaceae cyanobacterium]
MKISLLVNLFAKFLTISVAAIALYFSFNGYAGFLLPDFDSDQAIHALMAADLQLPADLYYWGQQRLGSIVPILGNFLLKHNNTLTAVEAVSYAQYFLLLIGYLSFASIFKTNIARILFAFAWFLPIHQFGFLLMLGQPYSAQLAFLGLAVALIDKLPRKLGSWQVIVRQVMITGAVICLFISLWASDFTLISIGLISLLAILATLYRIWLAPVTLFAPKSLSIALLFEFIALEIANVFMTSRYGVRFIEYAKSHAATSESHLGMNSPEQAQELFKLFTTPIAQTIASNNGNLLKNSLVFSTLSFWACAFTFLILYSLFRFVKLWLRTPTADHYLTLSPWFWVFSANAMIGFIAILFSEWVYINSIQDGAGTRYFVPVYVFVWLAALLLVEGIPRIPAQPLWAILLVVAITGSATLPASVYGFEKFEPTVQRLQAVQDLGPAGFIGNHWASYLLCSVNPKLLNCTQFDEFGQTPCPPPVEPPVRRHSGRCFRCVDRVLDSPTIYLVKNSWLEAYPDEIEQFGACLVRVGEPFDLAGYTFAHYQHRAF